MTGARIRLRDRGPVVVPLDLEVVRTGRRTTGEQPDDPAVAPWATRPLTVPDDDRGNVALCRCGHSATKPFCDGSHRGPDVEVDRDDTTEAPDVAVVGGGTGLSTCLAVEDDGPVRLCGGIVVTMPDGTTTRAPDGAGLCRCGTSSRRPWCDGSHRSCGFTESG